MPQTGKIRRITFVEFELAYNHFLTATFMPRTYGMILIASILKDIGYDVKIYCEQIAPIDMDRIRNSDLICFSPLTAAANKTFALADYIHKNWGIPTVAGGTFATYFTETCLDHFDYVVRNEGDDVMIELIHALEGRRPLDGIRGVSYRTPSGESIHHERTERVMNLDANQDLSLIEGFERKSNLRLLLLERRIRWLVLQASRGCPFSCDYCIVTEMYGRAYRTRNADRVMDDLRAKSRYGNYYIFMDNCFTANPGYTKGLLRRMIDEGIHGEFIAFVRVEAAKDDEMLSLMKRAGFIQLYIGGESINDEVYTRMGKGQTVAKLIDAIHRVQAHDLGITLSFQAGNDEDDRDAVRRTIDFGIEHDLNGTYIIPLWSWPEAQHPVISKKRMILKSLDYGTGHFVTHFPMRMKPSTLQREILAAQRRFWSQKRTLEFMVKGKWGRALSQMVQRYALSLFDKQVEDYIPYLERIEAGYYSADERLDPAKIEGREIDYRGEYREKYENRLVGKFINLPPAVDSNPKGGIVPGPEDRKTAVQ